MMIKNMIIEEVQAKTVVRKRKKGCDINLNPYQGCWHDCVYCDGKAENYHMHEDFGTRIKAKMNAPELLEKYLRKEGFLPVNRERTGTLADFGADKPKIIAEKFGINISGGVCDIYQPAEEKMMLARKCMQVVYDYDFPIWLLTKNKLVTRDIDLLVKINESQGATVAMTVTLADDELAAIFEPRATPTSERFEALRQLHDAGIDTGIWALPLLPWIGDTDENMDAIFSRAADAGVQWMCWSGMTLKPGRQKKEFLGVIEKHYPELLDGYTRMYANENFYGMPDIPAIKKMGVVNVMEKGKKYARKYGIRHQGW